MLQTKDDAVSAGALVGVRPREAAPNLRHAGLVWIAVDRRFGDSPVAPVPLDRGAVILLIIVVSTLELCCRRYTDRHHARSRRRLEGERRTLRFLLLLLLVRLRRNRDTRR